MADLSLSTTSVDACLALGAAAWPKACAVQPVQHERQFLQLWGMYTAGRRTCANNLSFSFLALSRRSPPNYSHFGGREFKEGDRSAQSHITYAGARHPSLFADWS